jgi:hypothetical protein
MKHLIPEIKLKRYWKKQMASEIKQKFKLLLLKVICMYLHILAVKLPQTIKKVTLLFEIRNLKHQELVLILKIMGIRK